MNNEIPFTPLAIYFSHVGEDIERFPVCFSRHQNIPLGLSIERLPYAPSSDLALISSEEHRGGVYQHNKHLSSHASFRKKQLLTLGSTMNSHFCSFC